MATQPDAERLAVRNCAAFCAGPHERCVLRLAMTTEENEMNVLEAINYRMNGGGCPGAGSLGECAAITESRAEGSASSYHTAHLYLHSGADDLTPAEVASWFHKLGATDVVVSAVLYDKDNNILNGSSIDDGVRPWDVSYFLPQNALAQGPGGSSPGPAGATGWPSADEAEKV